MRLIDLSVPLDPGLPCWWPGLEPFSVTTTYTLESVNTFSRNMHIEEHAGTHIDAPNHTGDENRRPYSNQTADALPLETLYGRARVIDVRHLSSSAYGMSPHVDDAILESFEDKFGPVRANEIVLLWTGWSDRYYLPFPDGDAYLNLPLAARSPAWPAATPDLIDGLVARGVRAVGVDTPTIGGLPDLALAHRAAFRSGLTPIENLINLGAIVGSDAMFLFLPLKITGSSGAPGRAVAMIDGPSQ